MNQPQQSPASMYVLPKVYRPRSFNLWGGPILAAGACLLVAVGGQLGGGFILLAVLGIILVPFGIFITVYGLLKIKKRAVLTDYGIVYISGATRIDWPWEKIEAVIYESAQARSGFFSNSSYCYHLKHENGQQISLDTSLHSYSELGAVLQEYIAHHRAPGIVTRFRNSQVVSFGEYAVDLEALWHNDQRLVWSEIDHIDLIQGRLLVYRHGQAHPWDIIPVFRLPNMRIFLDIVQAMVGIRQLTPTASLFG